MASLIRYYPNPTLVQLQPSRGPAAGAQLITIVMLGLEAFGSLSEALCLMTLDDA